MKKAVKRRRIGSTLAFLAAAIMALPASAQTVTGNITGVVTDATGAVIVGAKVVAHNVDTGVDSPATTNTSGLYIIRFLPIGKYEVTISEKGFGTQTVPAFSLEIDQTAKFNVQMRPGSEAQTVDVSAAAPILNTNDASLGETLTANEITNVPLIGLNFSSVTLYMPGAVTTNGPASMTNANAIERSQNYSDIPSINGQRSQANNYTLDGIDNNESQNNLISINPSPYAIEQMKIITANAPAQYGNVNGGDIITVLKSGTNKFHGDAFVFFQNYLMNANSWSNNLNHIPRSHSPYTQTQFGGSIGGPIVHNKLFFFGDYIGARYHIGGIGTATVFPAAMRSGDLSILLAPPPGLTGTNKPIQLYDTQNGFVPYRNNQITILNPVAKFLFSHPELYPLPNVTPTDGVAANNYQGPKKNFTVNNQFDGKIEWDPRAADKITGFYGQSIAYDGTTAVLAISFPSQNRYPTHIGGAQWVHIFSQEIVNAARAGFTRTYWNQLEPTDPSGQFGLTGNSKVGIPFPGTQAFPGYTAQNAGAIGGGGNNAQDGTIIDNTFTYGDDLTWQRGLHLISIGVQAMRYQNNYTTSNNDGFLGSMGYSGGFTSNPNPGAFEGNGYAPADFLLDRVNSAQVTFALVNVGNRQWRTAGYVQDDWKIRPNLTLNLGLRYEFDQPWYEQNNKTGNIDLNTKQVLYAGKVPAQAPPGSGLCSNRACYNSNYKQFMPRLGFAYQATDRFVVRGGYGSTSFFEGNAGNQRLTSIYPYLQSSAVKAIGVSAGKAGAPRRVEDGFSSDPANVNFSGSQFAVYPKNIQPAYVGEWSLTMEYALTRTLSLQAGYVGENGQHLIDYGNLNQQAVPDPSYKSAPYATVGTGSALGAVGGGGQLLITESRAAMGYNALQAVLRQRAMHGLEFTLNYTYSKSMTNSLGNYFLNVPGFSGAFQNYYNSQADWGVAGTDVTHNVSGVLVYDFPFGRGAQFSSGVNRLVDEVIGGWKISAAGVAYSGFPVTVTGSGGDYYNSFGTERANHYRRLRIVNRDMKHWYGTDPSATSCGAGTDNGVCAYGSATASTFGTAANGSERGPGFRQMDASAFKDFHITEGQLIGFRADASNVFNIVSWGNPNASATSAGFGQISGVRSSPRTLQLSLHYKF